MYECFAAHDKSSRESGQIMSDQGYADLPSPQETGMHVPGGMRRIRSDYGHGDIW